MLVPGQLGSAVAFDGGAGETVALAGGIDLMSNYTSFVFELWIRADYENGSARSATSLGRHRRGSRREHVAQLELGPRAIPRDDRAVGRVPLTT